MLNLKKTAVAVLALASSTVFAGTMGPVCSAVNVTVPCETTAWDFGADALYLQPVISGGDYNYVGFDSTGRYIDYTNKWGWGFKIEGSYHFNTGNDTNLNWYHLGKSSTRNFLTDYTLFGVTETITTGSASIDPRWDAVNLEFGQHVDFGENKAVRFHGGVEYARIANSTTITTTGTIGASAVTNTFTRKPTYNGFGPRLGADMGYDWGNGLGVYANGAAAVLVGSSKLSSSVTDSLVGTFSSSASKTTLVPELEAKLGIKYDYAMAQGDLTLDLGWMWVNYFNAVQGISISRTVRNNISDADFGVQGLYFGLKWLGNVA